jgi:segregation and condensation protein B
MSDDTDELDDSIETDPLAGAPSLAAALESLLMVAVEPMSTVTLAQASQHPVETVDECLRTLADGYVTQGRGFELREVAGGWRFYTAASCAGLLQRWVLDGQQARLTQASLETLAIVAYRQPVSRARIAAVRGVNVDGVMRTLVSRGLIEEAGTDASSGAILYRTTGYFLERLGISALEDLPDLAAYLPDLDELDEVLESVASGE